jgi:thiol-disulfide isomerase/thioredoxin
MKRSVLVLAAMLAVVGVVIWAGAKNLRARRAAMQAQEQAHLVVVPAGPDGAPPMDTHGGPSPLLHKPAPVFALTETDGKKVSLSDYKGRPVVVNFWATWCGPCKVEMPWFEEFRKKYAADGFEVLGVADDADAGKDAIAKSAGKLGVTYPILLVDDATEKAYGEPEVLPMSFYVDKAGTIVAVTAGLGTKDELEAKVKEVIAAGAR